jgi:hypothetical protein
VGGEGIMWRPDCRGESLAQADVALTSNFPCHHLTDLGLFCEILNHAFHKAGLSYMKPGLRGR